MRMIKVVPLALLLATASFTGGVEESLAGVTTPAAAAPALSGEHSALATQVRWGWRGGWRGGGWRGGGWGWRGGGWRGGWRGRRWGWGGPGWGGPGWGWGGGCRWTPWGWRCW
jgi:hypothetical protein